MLKRFRKFWVKLCFRMDWRLCREDLHNGTVVSVIHSWRRTFWWRLSVISTAAKVSIKRVIIATSVKLASKETKEIIKEPQVERRLICTKRQGLVQRTEPRWNIYTLKSIWTIYHLNFYCTNYCWSYIIIIIIYFCQ